MKIDDTRSPFLIKQTLKFLSYLLKKKEVKKNSSKKARSIILHSPATQYIKRKENMSMRKVRNLFQPRRSHFQFSSNIFNFHKINSFL
jgi:hypothetical protein